MAAPEAVPFRDRFHPPSTLANLLQARHLGNVSAQRYLNVNGADRREAMILLDTAADMLIQFVAADADAEGHSLFDELQRFRRDMETLDGEEGT